MQCAIRQSCCQWQSLDLAVADGTYDCDCHPNKRAWFDAANAFSLFGCTTEAGIATRGIAPQEAPCFARMAQGDILEPML